MVVLSTIFRCSAEIIQRIIHPSHIPFIIKTKSALVDRISHFRERSRIFGCEDHRRMHAFQSLIHILQELYRIEVYTPCRIALPVDRTADCIHADTVHMEFTDPVICAGLQEASGLSAGMHEVAASPFTDTDSRVRIFIKCSSVVIRQTISVHSEMNRNKIHQHTDIVFMAGIYEGFQLVRCSVTRSRAEKSGCLIAPGFITRVFIQWHDLEIVVAVFDQIRNQNVDHFFIIVPVICFIRRFAERTKMNFIDIEWFLSAVTAVLHPLGILKFIGGHVADNGSTVWTKFHAKSIRVAVVDCIFASVINFIFVHLSGFCLRNIAFPEVAVRNSVHFPFLPVIKFPDQCNAGGRRCKCTKSHTLCFYMCTKIFMSVKNFSCIKSVKIHGILLVDNRHWSFF